MKRWIAAVAVVAAVAIGVVVVIAGDSGSNGQAATTAGASATSGSAPDPLVMAQFQNCMSEHGVDVSGPPSGQPDAKTKKALTACSDLLPAPPSGAPAGPPSGLPAAPPTGAPPGVAPSTDN